jgi:hypothetical protein
MTSGTMIYVSFSCRQRQDFARSIRHKQTLLPNLCEFFRSRPMNSANFVGGFLHLFPMTGFNLPSSSKMTLPQLILPMSLARASRKSEMPRHQRLQRSYGYVVVIPVFCCLMMKNYICLAHSMQYLQSVLGCPASMRAQLFS